jgi:hypothetical protein
MLTTFSFTQWDVGISQSCVTPIKDIRDAEPPGLLAPVIGHSFGYGKWYYTKFRTTPAKPATPTGTLSAYLVHVPSVRRR